MKKWFDAILFSPDKTMQERMFLIGATFGSILMSILFLSVLLMGQAFHVASALGAGAVVLVVSTVFAFRTGNYKIGSADV